MRLRTLRFLVFACDYLSVPARITYKVFLAYERHRALTQAVNHPQRYVPSMRKVERKDFSSTAQ